MIRRKEYALEESHSGRDIDTDTPLSQGLRRGMKINMSMVFLKKTLVAGRCPRCHAVTDALEGVSIQWYVLQVTDYGRPWERGALTVKQPCY